MTTTTRERTTTMTSTDQLALTDAAAARIARDLRKLAEVTA